MTQGPITLFRGGTGEIAFEGEASPAPGGGSMPIGCLLFVPSVDLPEEGNQVFAIFNDEIVDNVTDQNLLDALPDGIGLTGYGTDTLTTTEAGVWAFTLYIGAIVADATWKGQLLFGHFNLGQAFEDLPVSAVTRSPIRSQTLNLPVDTGFSLGFGSEATPTADPYTISALTLAIVRLA